MMGNDRKAFRKAFRKALVGFCFFLGEGWTRVTTVDRGDEGGEGREAESAAEAGGCAGAGGYPITGTEDGETTTVVRGGGVIG